MAPPVAALAAPEATRGQQPNKPQQVGQEIELGLSTSDNINRTTGDSTCNYQNSADNHYQVYSARWLVLFCALSFRFIAALEKCFTPIQAITYQHLGTTFEDAAFYNVFCIMSQIVFSLPLAIALDSRGLKLMTYCCSIATLIAHILLAISFSPDDSYLAVPQKYRMFLFICGNIIANPIQSVSVTFLAKIAIDWFPLRGSTSVLAAGGSGYDIFSGLGGYMLARYVTDTSQLYIVARMYIITGIVLIAITLFCLRRSLPPSPPSKLAELSAETKHLPIATALRKASTMFTRYLKEILRTEKVRRLTLIYTLELQHQQVCSSSSVLLPLANLQLIISGLLFLGTYGVEALNEHGYSQEYLGSMMLVCSVVGVVASQLGAVLADRSADYVSFTKKACYVWFLAMAIQVLTHNMQANSYLLVLCSIIIVSNVSVLIPTLSQIMIRSSVGIIPEASIVTAATILGQAALASMSVIYKPIRYISEALGDKYLFMTIFYTLITLSANVLFIVCYKDTSSTNQIGTTKTMPKNQPHSAQPGDISLELPTGTKL